MSLSFARSWHPLLAAFVFLALASASRADEPSPREVFEQRLMPIFKSPNPSTCVQCHLKGVDLKNYILPDHEKTFRSLRDQGLIDLDRPEQSKILQLINMGAGDPKLPKVKADNQRAEYEAFAAWIKASAADPKLRAASPLDAKERPAPGAKPGADPLLDSFERNVWAWRFRCMNCHTEGNPQNDKLRKEHGERVSWMKRAGADATMKYLMASKLIDAKQPDKSLLLLKPLNEETHGGGVKFTVGDQGYKGFRTWIEDFAATRAGQSVAAKESQNAFGSEIWFKLANTPPGWGDKLLQADVYAWDAAKKAWSAEPVATSDRVVFGKGKVWQHTLTLLAPADSERAKTWARGKPTLPAGRYLVKVYLDADGRLAKDWKAKLGEMQYAGQAEFQAKWADGYGAMTTVDAGTIRR